MHEMNDALLFLRGQRLGGIEFTVCPDLYGVLAIYYCDRLDDDIRWLA